MAVQKVTITLPAKLDNLVERAPKIEHRSRLE